MRPKEKIEKLVSKLEVDTNPQKDKAVLYELLEAQINCRKSNQPNILGIILKNRITKLAAAAVIISSILLFVHYQPQKPVKIEVQNTSPKSRIELLTSASLTIAFRQGGMKALDDQFDKAFKSSNQKQTCLSVKQLLSEINKNGENSERENL